MMSDPNCCADCGDSLRRSYFICKKMNACDRKECPARLCRKCVDSHPLVLSDGGHIKDASVQRFCLSCFHELSVLDFNKTFDVIRPAAGKFESGTAFVFAHGGGGSRAMYRPYAEELCMRFGHTSILFDLPGHGSLVQTPLTLESCRDTLGRILRENNEIVAAKGMGRGKQTIYVGCSFGAYVGFYLLSEFKHFFCAAILNDCGQNVGPGASMKARLGLWFLSWFGSRSSNRTLMNAMLGVTKKSTADYCLIESTFGAGMFFDQAKAQVQCLKTVAPADYIPDLPFPILFMNGSKDYRDSEHKWLSLCANQGTSQLKVYEGGDHFFTHDSRFVDDILGRFNALATSVRSL